MPRLNNRGNIITGIAGMPGAVDQRPYPFAVYGGGAWVDDDTIILALQPEGYLHLWKPFEPGAPPVPIQPLRGCNEVAGGAGKWMAFIAGDGHLYGALGELPRAGAADIADDGSIVYKTTYQSNWGLTIVRRDGHVTQIPNAYPMYWQALPEGKAIWYQGAHGREPVRPALPNAQGIRLATLDGEDWILYWSEGVGLVLQVDGEPRGYIVETRPNAFNPDIRTVAGEVRIAWSLTAGEPPQDLVVVAASRAGVRFLINPEGRTPPVPGPLPPPHPPSAGPFAKPLHVGYFFKYSTPYGDNASAPGNVSVVTDVGAAQRAVGRIIPVADPLVLGVAATRWQDVVAIYCAAEEAGTQAALEALAAATILWMLAKGLPRRPILSYSADTYWPTLQHVDWVGVQLYVDPAEDPGSWAAITSTFTRRFQQAIDRVPPPRPVALICQAYTRNGNWKNPETLTALQAVFNELARLNQDRVRLVLWFSDGRSTGTRDNEYLRPWHAALAGAQPGLPPILTLTEPAPPVPVPVPPAPVPVPPETGYPSVRKVTFMDKEVVGLVGFGGKFVRIDPSEEGKGLFKGYPIHMDREKVGAWEQFEITKPDERYQIRHVATNTLLSADATQYSEDIGKQFSTRPHDKRGPYESWTIVKLPSGQIIALIEHEKDGRRYATASLAVVRQ